jgi:hypothetical protein
MIQQTDTAIKSQFNWRPVFVSALLAVAGALAVYNLFLWLISVFVLGVAILIFVGLSWASLRRRESNKALSYFVALCILTIPGLWFFAVSRTAIPELIRLTLNPSLFADCPKRGVSFSGGTLSVCEVTEYMTWSYLDAVVLDTSDEIIRAPHERSPDWMSAATRLHAPFGQLQFEAKRIRGHLYLVRFTEA